MTFYYETKLKLNISMNGFFSHLQKKTPAKGTLFNVNENESNRLLNDEMRERFHSIVAKLFYCCELGLTNPRSFL
jgi:hypothetical protein